MRRAVRENGIPISQDKCFPKMAKRRVGVLETHESPESSVAQTHCGRAIADYLVRQRAARPIGKRLIQMISGKAADAIRFAKVARDQARKRLEALAAFPSIMFWDGPMGIGNVLPFSRPTDPLHHSHYEIPMAGDRGPFARHRRKLIRVSARNRCPLAAPARPTRSMASGFLAGSALA